MFLPLNFNWLNDPESEEHRLVGHDGMREERIMCPEGQVGGQVFRGQEGWRRPAINFSICIVLRSPSRCEDVLMDSFHGRCIFSEGRRESQLCWDGPSSKMGSGPSDGRGRVSQNAFLLPVAVDLPLLHLLPGALHLTTAAQASAQEGQSCPLPLSRAVQIQSSLDMVVSTIYCKTSVLLDFLITNLF